MDLSRGAQLQNQKDMEMQSPWALATPATLATPNPERRPLVSGNGNEIPAIGPSSQKLGKASADCPSSGPIQEGVCAGSSSSDLRALLDCANGISHSNAATSSSASAIQGHNSSNTTPGNSLAGFSHIPVLLVTNAATANSIAHVTQVVLAQMGGRKEQSSSQYQFLSDMKLLPGGELYKDGNHSLDGISAPILLNLNVLPEETTRMGISKASSTPLAPVTPAKGEEKQHSLHHERCDSINEESSNKGIRLNFDVLQSPAETSGNQNSSTPIAPPTLNKGGKCHLQEVIDLVGQGPIAQESLHEICSSQPPKEKLGDPSFNHNSLQPIVASDNVSSQQQGIEQETHTSIVSSQKSENEEQREGQENKLDSTKKQKMRRKKHRPKVVIEGKSPKTSKPKTPRPAKPKPTGKNENQTGKRSYVRRKKNLNSLDNTPDAAREIARHSSIVEETAGSQISHKNKSVKRKLSFESELQGFDECLESAVTKEETQAQKRCAGAATRPRTTSTLQFDQGMEVEVENTTAGFAFDLNRSLNQMLDEYMSLPEKSSPSSQFARRNGLIDHLKDWASKGENADSINYLEQPTLKTDQRRFHLNGYTDVISVGDDQLEAEEKRNHDRSCTNGTSEVISVGDDQMEAEEKGKTDQRWFHLNGYTDVISVGDDQLEAEEKRNHSRNCTNGTSEVISVGDDQMEAEEKGNHGRSCINGIYHTSRCHETSSHSDQFPKIYKRKRTEKRQNQENNRSKYHSSKEFNTVNTQGFMTADRMQAPEVILTFGQTQRTTKKRSRLLIRARTSLSNLTSMDCNQLSPTPEWSPQACIDALLADTRLKTKTRKRTRKGHNLIKYMYGDANGEVEPSSYSSLGQKSVGSTALSRDFQGKICYLPRLGYIQDNQSTSNAQESPCSELMSQAIVPYGNPAYDTFSNSININWGQVGNTAELQNCLIPYGSRMLVPYEGSFDIKRKRPRAKVNLDQETNRVWKLLMGKEGSREEPDVDKEKWWEEERHVFCGRTKYFIARMRELQGHRGFSPWKGSVVDSVVGVFLTQNVSDHLSSSAFMALAARFPPRPRGNDTELNAKKMSTTTEQDGSTVAFDKTRCQEIKFDLECDQGSQVIYDTDCVKEKEIVNTDDTIESSIRVGMVGDSDYKVPHVLKREQEIDLEAPDDKTDASITETGGTESEDRSREDVVSSQNSVASFDYSYSQTQTTDKVGLGLATTFERDLITGRMFNGVSNSTSYEESVHITETRTHEEEPYTSSDGAISLAEVSGSLNQDACVDCERRTNNDGSCDPRGIHESIMYVANSQHSQHDTRDESSVPSTSSHSDNFFRFRPLGTNHVNLAREESNASMPATACSTANANNINIIRGNCNLLTENRAETLGHQSQLSQSRTTFAVLPCTQMNRDFAQSPSSSDADNERAKFQQEERKADFQGENFQQTVEVLAQVQHCPANQACSTSCHKATEISEGFNAVQTNLTNEVSSFQNIQTETAKSTSRAKKANIESEKTFDWDSLRKEACHNGYQQQRSKDRMDSLDWEAVRCADVSEISEAIRERGMNNILGGRIKDFLNRVARDHGSIDLEWLRDVPPDKAKDYLLSIRGLGLKSVECVRLLTLHHLAFPVDTNVGRICVRLGWVPLQPLPESLQLHLLELYPMMETIQKYLWPRLCTLDQRTLYELHYQMITFGKVFCTKSKPNCNACPMRLDCKHFASAFASARLALPGPEEKSLVSSTTPPVSEHDHIPIFNPTSLPQLEASNLSHGVFSNNCEPVIEEPASPEPECTEIAENDIEDAYYEDPDEIPTIKLNVEEFTQNLQSYIQQNNMALEDNDMAKALVAITAEAASIPMPKLKNVTRLRTEHQVYELPDSHQLLKGLDQREPDDPCPYLLAIWTPGETAQSIEPPETHCEFEGIGKLCDKKTCFACSCRREEHAQTVRGTILIPCRTANRGSFPLNGTYFQVNEVFADHESSHSPIDVPRRWIWNLPRRTVYFGTSIPTIFRGLSTEPIQHCFWRGFVCVRGFDRTARVPRPLCHRLHCAASKTPKNKTQVPKDG